MENKTLKIRAQRFDFDKDIKILVFERDIFTGRKSAIAKPIEFESSEAIKPGRVFEPTLSICNETAQGLMDDLWSCGIRPTEGSGSAGSLAATERHLADMQKIAFSLMSRPGLR